MPEANPEPYKGGHYGGGHHGGWHHSGGECYVATNVMTINLKFFLFLILGHHRGGGSHWG